MCIRDREKGPFIVVTGHDLKDLQLLLEQTSQKGINVYTHGEMLPAHAYPELKKYPHLKGNFGTAWQNQQKEFADIPAPILFTTNCLMPPKASYADRVFTTEVVSFPGTVHIDDRKDFTPVIEKALSLGGYPEEMHFSGINGGTSVTTGFGHGAVLSVCLLYTSWILPDAVPPHIPAVLQRNQMAPRLSSGNLYFSLPSEAVYQPAILFHCSGDLCQYPHRNRSCLLYTSRCV